MKKIHSTCKGFEIGTNVQIVIKRTKHERGLQIYSPYDWVTSILSHGRGYNTRVGLRVCRAQSRRRERGILCVCVSTNQMLDLHTVWPVCP